MLDPISCAAIYLGAGGVYVFYDWEDSKKMLGEDILSVPPFNEMPRAAAFVITIVAVLGICAWPLFLAYEIVSWAKWKIKHRNCGKGK